MNLDVIYFFNNFLTSTPYYRRTKLQSQVFLKSTIEGKIIINLDIYLTYGFDINVNVFCCFETDTLVHAESRMPGDKS